MELNPNHAVTQELRHQWHKLCALVMAKTGLTTIEITGEDIERLHGMNIVAHPKDDVITLRLVDDAEARRLVRKEGGLPI